MKTLFTLLMLVAGACLAVTIINPYQFTTPATPPPPSVPTDTALSRQYQSGNDFINDTATVQFQSSLAYYNTVVTLQSQFQSGDSFINKRSAVNYQNGLEFQN